MAKFQNEADFGLAKFQNEADFNWATFEGETSFEGIKGEAEGQEENLCFYGTCFFNEIELGEKARVIFNKVDLGRASFLDTDIKDFTFRDVTWHRPLKARPRREKALYDEFRHLYSEEGKKDESPEEVDYSKLAENYSQLVINYENKRDFISAHEFRIGEMESRRKSLGTSLSPRWRKIRRWANAYTVYRILSNYGTSYWQAMGALFLMLLAFAWLFLFSGFQPLSPEGSPLNAINYKPWFDFSNTWQTLCDYGKSVLFTLSILTLQRSRFYVPLGGLSQLWLFLAMIMFYSQVTLLLLAIRRRFKQ